MENGGKRANPDEIMISREKKLETSCCGRAARFLFLLIVSYLSKERGVYFILGEIWKLESISILISLDSFCEFLSRIDLEKLERYKFSVSKVEKFRKYPRISNSFYQFFKGSRVLCTKSKRIGGKFDQRSLNLTFLNEIFYSAYYIPR